MSGANQTIKIIQSQVLSDDWYSLKKYTVDYQRRDGRWQRITREVYDKGDGAALLLYNALNQTVILTRQLRLPAYIQGENGFLIEVAAGLLEGEDPEQRIKMEAEEETGFRIAKVTKLFSAWMSPGAVTEKLHFFTAEYLPQDKVDAGGGLEEEGEDLEVLEMPFKQALAAISSGEICDGKTIMLLHYAALHRLLIP